MKILLVLLVVGIELWRIGAKHACREAHPDRPKRVHGDPDNLDSLKDKRQHGIFALQVSSRKMPQGNYRKATEQYIELLLETIEKPPKELGYEFGTLDGGKIINVSATDRN